MDGTCSRGNGNVPYFTFHRYDSGRPSAGKAAVTGEVLHCDDAADLASGRISRTLFICSCCVDPTWPHTGHVGAATPKSDWRRRLGRPTGADRR